MEATTRNNQPNMACATDSAERALAGLFTPGLMFNGRAVRARAGILNIVIGVTIARIVMEPNTNAAWITGAVLMFDMIGAVLFGPTPVSPTGILGTLLTLGRNPVETPHLPKRFAWVLGTLLSATCLVLGLLQVDPGWVVGVFAIFFVLTWLDAVLGFCVGCWIYSMVFGCSSCDISDH